jgi:hypothetical protein
MTQPIIHDPPEFGSVEHFVAQIRAGAGPDLRDLRPYALGVIIALVDQPKLLVNAVRAADQLSDELVAATSAKLARLLAPLASEAPVACSDECAARPEEWPCLDSCPAQRAARGES